jgi:hypothetical protein
VLVVLRAPAAAVQQMHTRPEFTAAEAEAA